MDWADAADTYHHFIDNCPNVAVVELMEALHSFLKHSPMMAYLAMMAPRLVELHRVLKSTGSLYLHCDPTASHYLRLILDETFGAENFRNELIWRRTRAHNDAKLTRFGSIHDVILFYAKSEQRVFNRIVSERADSAPKTHDLYRHTDGKLYRKGDCRAPGNRGPKFEWNGHVQNWRFTPEMAKQLETEGKIVYSRTGMPRVLRPVEETKEGSPLQDVWTDIDALNSGAAERLGYQTQKPLALLERIITASTNPGNVVLDPFCGCGTTIHAAQKLGRQWIGIDITYLAINLIKRRLKDAFGEEIEFEEKGQPTDFGGAKQLAENDKFQFQHWTLSLIGARPLKEGDGKGADRGVDGLLYFYEADPSTAKKKSGLKSENVHREKIIVQVKGGGVNRSDVATLLGDVNNQKAVGGVLITLENPTKQMRTEVADAGRFKSNVWHEKDYPKIQILTIEGLLGGTERVDAPPPLNPFAMAAREATEHKQTEML